ncbi:MAG: class I adenylate-forming enzyme family protein [Xanthobacteraceae bacterium]
MNIVEPILFQARYQPEAPALCAQGIDVVSFSQLCTQMNNVARRATASGLKRGSVVALSIDQPLLHAAVILGLSQAGIIPMSIAMQKPPVGLKIDAVISNTDYPFASAAPRLPLAYSWIMGEGAPVEPLRNIDTSGDEVCRIVLTAGTTGDPKAVALTHNMVMARNARFDYVFGNRQPTCSRVYMHIGLAAALGYQFLIYILGRGGTVFFRGDTIENTLRAFAIFQIQAMLATPATLAQLLAICDRHPSIEIHLDTILSGGSLLPLALAERIRPRLCTHLITGYGSTETAISATAPAHRIAHIEGAAGYITPGIRIEIVDETDRPVAVGSEGHVRVASDFAVARYIDDPVETAQMFRNGWFYPGDIGTVTADNLLIISGRQNNVLNAGGGKMAAEKIEAVLMAFKGVSEAAVFMATNKIGVEEVWAAIVCNEKIDIDRLRMHCRPRMPVVFVPAHFVTLDALPTSDLGKIDRSRLKQILMAASSS